VARQTNRKESTRALGEEGTARDIPQQRRLSFFQPARCRWNRTYVRVSRYSNAREQTPSKCIQIILCLSLLPNLAINPPQLPIHGRQDTARIRPLDSGPALLLGPLTKQEEPATRDQDARHHIHQPDEQRWDARPLFRDREEYGLDVILDKYTRDHVLRHRM